MPPKKKKGRKGGKGKNNGDDEPEPLAFGTKGKWTRTGLLTALKRQITSQKTIAEKIEHAMPDYFRCSAENREEYLQGKGSVLKKKTRDKAAKNFMDAQVKWEDFFFYQNEVNRWKRYSASRPTPHEREQARRLKKPPMLIDRHGDSERFEQYHREMLNYYDQQKVGTPQYRYRQGELRAGKAEASTGPREILLEPDSLHLFTPAWRHVPAGLRRMSVLRDMERATQVPIWVRVNEEAIERVRRQWDDAVDETEDVEYRTHMERRIAEREAYNNTRPSTANILVKSNENGGQIDDDRFRSIQTASGVFISALESSDDWLTSYDCLGLVKNCSIPEHFETSAVREEDRWDGPPDEDEDFDAQFNPPSDEMDDGSVEKDGGDGLPVGRNSSATRATPMNNDEPDDTGLELKNGKRLSSSPPPKAKQTPKKTDATTPTKKKKNVAGKADAKKGTTGDEGWKNVRASIDYPYDKLEFCLPKKTRKVSESRLVTTDWAEATDGRREHHVGMVHKPYSPVNSPPHSPIEPDSVDMSTIPETYWESDDLMTGGEGFLNGPKRRRCQHGNATCRAWWTHATDECWALNEEPTILPTDRTDIDAPIMLGFGEGSHKTYRGRLHDHYGRRGHGKGRWPRLGIRVAYEPTTLADVERDGTNASLQGWRSLAMPVIEEALHEENKWNMDADPVDDCRSSDEESELDMDLDLDVDADSEDEGDLFHMSYEQSSFPHGRPAPVIPPTVAPGSGTIGDANVEGAASEDGASTSDASMPIVPAEDHHMESDADDL